MCGIFGAIASRTLGVDHINFVEDSFQAGQLRGRHGSGMMVVGQDGKQPAIRLAKAVVGTSFWFNDDVRNLVNAARNTDRVLIGHNRHTTSGDNVDDHCHPFQFGPVTGVHNGGFPDTVLGRVDHKKSHEVDSGRIYAALSKADDPISVLSQLHAGAYALVWHDARTNSIYFTRNLDRPLHVAETNQGLFFTSELGMLTWLLSRNTVIHGDTRIGLLDTNKLYRYPLDEPGKVEATAYSSRPAVTPYVPARPIHRPYHHQNTRVGRPARRPFQTFYTSEKMIEQFSCLEPGFEVIERCTKRVSGIIQYVYIGILGRCHNNTGDRAIYGMLLEGDVENLGETGTLQVHPSFPVTMPIVSDQLEERIELMLKSAPEGQVPIIRGSRQSFVVRPDGSITIRALPALSPEAWKSEAWAWFVETVTPSAKQWVYNTAVGAEISKLDDTQVDTLWMALGKGHLITDQDIPF